MRIRSTKPEFWRSKTIRALPWEVVYDGPKPKRVNLIAPQRSDLEYVYMLWDEAQLGVHRIHRTPPNIKAFEAAAVAELCPLHNIVGRAVAA